MGPPWDGNVPLLLTSDGDSARVEGALIAGARVCARKEGEAALDAPFS